MTRQVLIMDEIVAEDSGPCDICGKPIRMGSAFVQDDFLLDEEQVAWQYHLICAPTP